VTGIQVVFAENVTWSMGVSNPFVMGLWTSDLSIDRAALLNAAVQQRLTRLQASVLKIPATLVA
jgi:hypothetical protein